MLTLAKTLKIIAEITGRPIGAVWLADPQSAATVDYLGILTKTERREGEVENSSHAE